MNEKLFDQESFKKLASKLLSSEKVNKSLMDSLPFPALIIGKDRVVVAANKKAEEIGVNVCTFCWDSFGKKASITSEDKDYFEKFNKVPKKGIKCVFCQADEALRLQKPINKKIDAGEIVYDTYWVPLTDNYYLHYALIV